MWADPNITKYISGRPSTEQQTWMRLLSYVGHWSILGFGYWAIEERRSGDFVGEVGFADFKRNISSPMKNAPELGFALATKFHGRGFATEAVRAVLGWGDRYLAARRSVCLVHAQNAVSLHLLDNVGYRIFERTTYNDQATVFLSRESK
jgi:RimJ/RimL family protein N-acetyltransferase